MFGLIAAFNSPPTFAQDLVTGAAFTAKTVLELPSQERAAYLSGLVEGLAYARYVAGGKDKAGMACINDWFFENTATLETIHAGFERWPDYLPGAIVGLMAERACPP